MATKPAAKPQLRPVAAEETPEEPPKKKGKLLPALILAIVLLGGGGGGAAWYFLHKSAPADAATKAPEPPKPPVFVTLEPFTVNLQGGDHFLQLGIVLQVKDEATSEAIKTFLPQIRNRLLLLLSSKSPTDLESVEAKKKLADDILAETRQPLGDAGAGVQSVLFGSMVIQ